MPVMPGSVGPTPWVCSGPAFLLGRGVLTWVWVGGCIVGWGCPVGVPKTAGGVPGATCGPRPFPEDGLVVMLPEAPVSGLLQPPGGGEPGVVGGWDPTVRGADGPRGLRTSTVGAFLSMTGGCPKAGGLPGEAVGGNAGEAGPLGAMAREAGGGADPGPGVASSGFRPGGTAPGCSALAPGMGGTVQFRARGDTGSSRWSAGILRKLFSRRWSGRIMALAGRAAPGTPRRH